MIVKFGEIAEAREQTEREGERGVIVREYRRRFLVVTNDPSDDSNVVKSAVGIPRRYFPYITPHSYDPAAKCVEISARQRGSSPYAWEVECRYSTEQQRPEAEQADEDNPNPLDEPEDIEFGTETERVPIRRIYTPGGDLFSTTEGLKAPNGEVLDPQPEVDEHYMTLIISRNEELWNPHTSQQYTGTVNSDTFFGAPAGTVKCRSITARRVVQRGVRFWRVTYEFVYRAAGWNLELLNVGTYYNDSDNGGKKTAFVTEDDPPQPYVGLLNENGDKSSTPTYTTYQPQPWRPFADLHLPQQLA